MIDTALREAFEETDAACRRHAAPTARQLFLRALALLALGDVEASRRDMKRAMEGPSDLDILAVQLRLDPDVEVARAIVSCARSSGPLIRRAAAIILKDEPLVLRTERTQVGVDVLAVCDLHATPGVHVDGTAVAFAEVVRDRETGVAAFRFRHPVAPATAPRIDVELGRHRVASALAPRAMTMVRPPSRRGVVSVVVPVHGGRDATRACLEALARQRCRCALDVVVVDDACPDAALAAEAEAMAAREGWRHIRNGRNLGFAAAVNRGAAATEGDHVLLLNADAMLPVDGITRMLAAAAAPGVGTVVPLSNDGGFASFPITRKANPATDAAEAGRIDDAARQLRPPSAALHAEARGAPPTGTGAEAAWAIDIPAGTAFCMLVTGPCWDALGGLDLGYGRGYFEDVDLCLRARRIGLRNVVAPGVYVRHLGGQSFGAAKKSLVADNARLLLERFPDYDADWMAFAEGDPLAAVRDGLERRLPPPGPVHLVAGRRPPTAEVAGGGAGSGAAKGATESARVLVLQEGRDGERRIRAVDGGVPQTLCFRSDERAAWADYMTSLSVESVSLADPSEALARDLAGVVPATAAVSAAAMGPRSLRLIAGRTGLFGRARIGGLDAMSRAALGESIDPLPPPAPAAAGPPRLAALVPWPTAAVDRWLLALDRRLRAGGGEVVILGEGFGGRARPPASGPMERRDYPGALRHRGITHLLLPDAEAPFGILEDLRRACPLPCAYVDWAPGRHRAAPGDLALPLGSADAERVSALAAWCLTGAACGRAPA